MNILIKSPLVETLIGCQHTDKNTLESYYRQFAKELFDFFRGNADTIESAFVLGYTHIELSTLLDETATDEVGEKSAHPKLLCPKSDETYRASA